MKSTIGKAGTPMDDSQTAAARPLLSERIVFRFYKLGQLVSQAVEARLAEVGLTGRRYFVLAGTSQGRPVSQQDLSRMLGIDPTTIVAIVDELEAADFVRRERSTVDRRRYDLHLTEAGKAALAAADTVVGEVEAEFFSMLPPAELENFTETAHTVISRVWP